MSPKGRKRPIRKRNNKKETSILRQVLYGVLAISIVVFVGFSMWYVTRLPSLTIENITIEGGETIDHDSVRSRVEQELKGSYYLLIPRRFVYTYPHEAILESLQTVPRIHMISVERRNRTELKITFNEYAPHALWCLDGAAFSECYFMDADGYAFAPAPSLYGGAFTRHVIEGEKVLSEKQIIPKERLRAIETFTDALESGFSMRVTKITHSESGDLTYHINGGGDLLVSGEMDTDEVLQNLQSILESEEFNHLEPGNFNYIDLRFGNKIFVNEELETDEETEAGTTSEKVLSEEGTL